MYKRIDARRSVRKLYTETLVRRGDLTLEQAEAALDDFMARMQGAFEETRQSAPPDPVRARAQVVSPIPDELPPAVAKVDRATLDAVAAALQAVPDGFTLHPKLARQNEGHHALYEAGEVDWHTAEALAFGTLLAGGTDIRLTGQDTRRGTFSHRHAVLVDYENGREWTPLAGVTAPEGEGAEPGRTGKFWTYDSMLSEYAALGFEYGYSVAHKEALVAWEAQFGDFANGGQVIIDQFIAAAEDKWGQTSGLVLLLPHGYEGQGPEHSSARIERFLALCAGANLRVANPTTAAQYFHLLRSQVLLPVRKPLVIFTPKSLLRARVARSQVAELADGSFQTVIDDPGGEAGGVGGGRQRVRRVILASGKVAYEAMAAGSDRPDVAVIRVEQLNPWPEARLDEVLAGYPDADELVWLQEEPENMGPWPFVHERLHRLVRGRFELRHVSRRPSAGPATGSHTVHAAEQAELIDASFAGL